MKEIRDLTSRLNAADSKVSAQQQGGSRLGELEDDNEAYEREQLRRQREEYAKKMQELEDKVCRRLSCTSTVKVPVRLTLKVLVTAIDALGHF